MKNGALNLRESTMLYFTYPVNSSKETKRPWTLGLSVGEACSGSTEIHSVLTVIKLIHESASDFSADGFPDIGAHSSVFFRGSP